MCLFDYRQFGQFDYPQGGGGGQAGYGEQYGAPQASYTGSIMTPDPVSVFSSGDASEDFENEPPLMEGIGLSNQTLIVLQLYII